MGQVVSFVASHPFREALVGRLVRLLGDQLEGCRDSSDILRACLGAALDNDPGDAETHWLICGLECRLGMTLTAMGRTA